MPTSLWFWFPTRICADITVKVKKGKILNESTFLSIESSNTGGGSSGAGGGQHRANLAAGYASSNMINNADKYASPYKSPYGNPGKSPYAAAAAASGDKSPYGNPASVALPGAPLPPPKTAVYKPVPPPKPKAYPPRSVHSQGPQGSQQQSEGNYMNSQQSAGYSNGYATSTTGPAANGSHYHNGGHYNNGGPIYNGNR